MVTRMSMVMAMDMDMDMDIMRPHRPNWLWSRPRARKMND